MNTQVSVTGMEVRTKVGSNLLIAEDTLANKDAKKTADFKNAYITTTDVALLEPASTIDGVHFFYTDTSNVKADGDAASDSYKAVDSNFGSNYNESTAVDHVDYVFQLRGINTDAATNKAIQLDKLVLTYGDKKSTTQPDQAWRVAIFVQQLGTEADGTKAVANDVVKSDYTFTALTKVNAVDDTTGTDDKATTIYTVSGAANFTSGSAVGMTGSETAASVQSLAVAYNTSSTNISMPVPAGKTAQFKVVVRLWLEGEDNTCNNTTYANLQDKWALDLSFKLVDSATQPTALTYNDTASKIAIYSMAISTDATKAKVIDGVKYNLIGESGTYYTNATAIAAGIHVYNITDANVITDITNQCELVAPPST